jgi:hypothetical protein
VRSLKKKILSREPGKTTLREDGFKDEGYMLKFLMSMTFCSFVFIAIP